MLLMESLEFGGPITSSPSQGPCGSRIPTGFHLDHPQHQRSKDEVPCDALLPDWPRRMLVPHKHLYFLPEDEDARGHFNACDASPAS